jgi:hypothetical protein
MQKKNPGKGKGIAEKPRLSAAQRKIRRQQISMAVIGLILIVAMIMALTVR